jgi:DNA-binding transcriptional LysR family regulator
LLGPGARDDAAVADPELVRTAVSEPAGEVTIGFPSAFTAFLSAGLVDAVRSQFPRVKLQVFEGDSVLQRECCCTTASNWHCSVSMTPPTTVCIDPLFGQRLALVSASANADAEAAKPISSCRRPGGHLERAKPRESDSRSAR